MRLSFLVLLFVSCIWRALSLIFVISVAKATQNIFIYMFSQHLPGLLFITTYSILIYFFAKVLSEEQGTSKSYKIFTICSNIIIYTIFLFIAFSQSGNPTSISESFSKTISGFHGVYFAALSVILIVFGYKVGTLLWQLKETESNLETKPMEDSLISLLYKRVYLLTAILAFIFTVTASFNFAFAWGLMEPKQTDKKVAVMNPLLLEALVQAFSELIPSFVILYLTHRNRRKKDQYYYYYENLIDSESDEEFGGFNPNRNK